MLRNKQKAQGMVEFALILPLLLLLLVGVIEAARIIWAYMTVQTAAREAARYAISGRPYINPNYADNGPGGRAAFPNSDCLEPEGTPGQDTPWACHESLRVEAIKMVAMNRISSTMPWTQACDSPAEFAQGSACENVPGALGVLVVGQFTDPLTPSVVLSAPDHPGEQGLNVKIT
ncbi:MAG TPA: TadE family protein, partial [Anaerolineae bacterium]|nr:TadE family protein [Anaerolineae bacterium]